MPKFGYSIFGIDPDTTAKGSAREVKASPKAAREICATIKNMRLNKAKEFLEEVILKKKPVPFRYHKKKVAHRKGLSKWYAGRYPVKAAKEILKVLQNVEANAEAKGLDVDGLKIIHAAVHRGRVIRKYIPRAFGRSTPYFETLIHIEIVASQLELGELEEEV
ncbi:MAG: 50S ribosomal protein L22 [Candidatus Odinarchaeia archaeon]